MTETENRRDAAREDARQAREDAREAREAADRELRIERTAPQERRFRGEETEPQILGGDSRYELQSATRVTQHTIPISKVELEQMLAVESARPTNDPNRYEYLIADIKQELGHALTPAEQLLNPTRDGMVTNTIGVGSSGNLHVMNYVLTDEPSSPLNTPIQKQDKPIIER
jgi:hypothetical protein